MDQFSKKAEEAGKEFGKKMGDKIDYYFKDTRGGRITGCAFSIFWSTLFLVFFNYYNQYIAYYDYEKTREVGSWTMHTFITADFDKWLQVVTTALIAAIIGNIILIIYDSYFFRHIVRIAIDLFSIASVISLLVIFPFDFSVFPNQDLSNLLNPIVTIVLILISVGIGIGIVVRFIKLAVSIARKT